MSFSRAKRLNPLIQIAQKSVNEALGFIGQLQQRIISEQEKSTTLNRYLEEYQAGFQTKGQGGINGLALQQFESFVLQIEQAMENQAEQVKRYQEQLSQAQKIYVSLNQRLLSYEKLAQRLNEQGQQAENLQMQKFLDDIGAQLHRLNHSS